MKILQITHYGSLTNYGALLQAYALQRALTELGHDVTLLRASFSFHNILKKWYKNPLRVVKAWNRRRAELEAEKKHPRKFSEFASRYMKLSELEFHSHKDLIKAGLTADALVTGSDQVWSSKKPSSAYFLEFGPVAALRFSYAASVGSKACMDAKYLSEFKKKTRNFSGISVREKEALEQCFSAGINTAIQVPDPVMLFSPEQWRQQLNLSTTAPERRYCLIYTVGHNRISVDSKLAEYCRKKGIQIIAVPAQHHTEVNAKGVQCVYPTIPEFLSLIDNADFVVTDSFHGTAFSLLLNTPFVVIPKNSHDARFITLDEYFNISGAYFQGDIDSCLAFNFDFDAINEKINALRSKGWDFLRRTTGVKK